MAPIIQISLDVSTVEEALGLAEIAIRTGVDWLEVGTPLITCEGLRAIRALREAYPNTPIVADTKTMDGGAGDHTRCVQAGATTTVVMGQAHDATIRAQVEAARRHGGSVMCDVMLCADKAERARQAEAIGVDTIIVHTGYDERGMHPERTPLDDLASVLAAVTIPVQAVGGLSIDQAIETVRMGAQMVVFGAPLVIRSGRPAPDAEAVLREIVPRVKAAVQ